MNSFGLPVEALSKLKAVFKRYSHLEKVILYGSRAKGNYNSFSDIDITLAGKLLTKDDLTSIIFAIDDLLLPYEFDISIFHQITNPDVVDHINRVGQIIYKRNSD